MEPEREGWMDNSGALIQSSWVGIVIVLVLVGGVGLDKVDAKTRESNPRLAPGNGGIDYGG